MFCLLRSTKLIFTHYYIIFRFWHAGFWSGNPRQDVTCRRRYKDNIKISLSKQNSKTLTGFKQVNKSYVSTRHGQVPDQIWKLASSEGICCTYLAGRHW